MNKEQIEQKAKDYANKWLQFVKDLEMERKTDPKPEYIRIEEAYIAGATENDNLIKQVGKLKAQIEKMKNCGNCKHQCSFLFQDEIDCLNKGLPKWEIKENG